MKNILIVILLFITACSKTTTSTTSAIDELGFFDIVYETVATRTLGDTTWIAPIVGTREVKFLTTTTVSEDDALPSVLEGTFTYSVQGYARLSSQTPCSGGFNGTFSMTYSASNSSTTTTTSTSVTTEANYDIMTPYNTTDSSSTSTSDETVATINTFEFDLTVLNKSFTPTNCMTPGSTNTIKIVRFSNGDLIEDDPSKNLQYYLQPKLRITR
jgi:hypothetical protein